MEPGSNEQGAAGIADPSLRRAFGLDLDGDAWIGRMRDFCAEPSLGMLGPYELLATAGRGGQGLVFKSRQPRTGRIVAIKRLAAGRFSTPDMRARFQREVEAVAALDHPHIVTVYGSEEMKGEPVLVMRWIDGVPFDQWARPIEGVHRTVTEVLTAFVKVCDAVAHAHQRGIIHRDLKPSNVLVDAANEPHVLDFGLARRDDDASDCPTLTLSGAVLGTPVYAPPEQLRGDVRNVDARSDVYSLGAMLYRALTGSTPVDGGLSHFAMAERIERVGPRSPAELNPELNREICSILQKALRGEPQERYPTVDALSEDIHRFLSGRPIAAHPPGAGYRLRKFVRRNRVGLLVAGVIVIAVGIGLIQSLRTAGALARESKTRKDAELLDANGELQAAFDRAVELEKARKRNEAEALYVDVLTRRRALVGADHWSTIDVTDRLGKLLIAEERYQESLPYLEMGYSSSRKYHGPDHPITIDKALALAHLHILLANYRQAEEVCLSLPKGAACERDRGVNSSLFLSLLLQQRFGEALAPLQCGLVHTRRKFGPAHRYTSYDISWCDELLLRNGDASSAKARFEQALAILAPLVEMDRKAGDQSVIAGIRLGNLGFLLLRIGRLAESERTLREANSINYGNDALSQTRKGTVMCYLGECLLQTDQTEEAERLLIEGQGLMRDQYYIQQRFQALLALIDHYDATGRAAEAAHWRDCLARRPFLEWLPPGANPAN